MQKLPRSFYDRPTIDVAQALLGQYLVHEHDGLIQVGKIVETEAYLGPHDLAAHSCRGVTPRTQIMFGPPGYAYVYLIYGIYHCLNVVTEAQGHGSAVLLRAVEPIQQITHRTQGPGLLCKAMAIDKRLNGHDLLSNDFYLVHNPAQSPFDTVSSPRVGVDYAGEWASKPLRFYIKDNPFVSRKK